MKSERNREQVFKSIREEDESDEEKGTPKQQSGRNTGRRQSDHEEDIQGEIDIGNEEKVSPLKRREFVGRTQDSKSDKTQNERNPENPTVSLFSLTNSIKEGELEVRLMDQDLNLEVNIWDFLTIPEQFLLKMVTVIMNSVNQSDQSNEKFLKTLIGKRKRILFFNKDLLEIATNEDNEVIFIFYLENYRKENGYSNI